MHELPAEYRDIVDPAVDAVIDALREISCDYPEEDESRILVYALTRLMNLTYSAQTVGDITTVLGILEMTKQECYQLTQSK